VEDKEFKMFELLIGFVVGVAASLLVQRFFPSKWFKLTATANKEIDKRL
jgi:multisubunit Na+/H+ antiporter MnhE subunit